MHGPSVIAKQGNAVERATGMASVMILMGLVMPQPSVICICVQLSYVPSAKVRCSHLFAGWIVLV